jgi:hypothetical protein
MPIGGMEIGESDDDGGDEGCGEEHGPAKNAASDAQERIRSVIDFLAEKTPERRFPKNGMLAPEMKAIAGEPVNAESASDGDENAGISAEVEMADGETFVCAKREMNTETRDDEENDDGGSAKDDRAPAVSEGVTERSGFVDASEERENAVVANGDPESEHETEGVEYGVAGVPVNVREVRGAAQACFSAMTK